MSSDRSRPRRFVASYALSVVVHGIALLLVLLFAVDFGDGPIEALPSTDRAQIRLEKHVVLPPLDRTAPHQIVTPRERPAVAAASAAEPVSSPSRSSSAASTVSASAAELARTVRSAALASKIAFPAPQPRPSATHAPVARVETATPHVDPQTPSKPSAPRPVEPTSMPSAMQEPASVAPPPVAAQPTPVPIADVAAMPTLAPTTAPTVAPTATPTVAPTVVPTAAPTVAPTQAPTIAPAAPSTTAPTQAPSALPTTRPSAAPTTIPMNAAPSAVSSRTPTVTPTIASTHAAGAPSASHAPEAPHHPDEARPSASTAENAVQRPSKSSGGNALAALNARLNAISADGTVDYRPKRVETGDAQGVIDRALSAYEAALAPPADILRRTFGVIYERRSAAHADSIAYVFDTYALGPITMCKAWKIIEHPIQDVREVGAVARSAGIGGGVVTSANSPDVRHDNGGRADASIVQFPCSPRSYTSIAPGSLSTPLPRHPDIDVTPMSTPSLAP